jgi:hypothetical protein
MCGVGKFMKRWKLRQDDLCPRCGQPEDSVHVWICHGEGADNLWEKSITNLEGWLNSRDSDPDLQHLVTSYLRSWRDDTASNSSTTFLFEHIVHSQAGIGWRSFFEGWLAKEWTRAQQAYYSLIKSRRSGKRWTVELIKKLWDIAWDFWEHRNGVLQEQQNLVSNHELRCLNRKVIEAYSNLQSHLLPAHDRHLILLKLSRLLKKKRYTRRCGFLMLL